MSRQIYLIISAITIGHNMASSAIWSKKARVNFSKKTNCTSPYRASNLSCLRTVYLTLSYWPTLFMICYETAKLICSAVGHTSGLSF